MTDIPKFKGHENPLNHIRAFKDYMSIKGIKPEMFLRIFPSSLDTIPKQWFYSLEHKKIATWDDAAIEFAKQYADNAEIQVNMRTLEVLTQNEKEGFTDFLSRWRKTSTQLVERPDEATLVEKFVDNLKPIYANHLRYQNIKSFKDLTVLGTRIEDDIRKGLLSKTVGRGYQGSTSRSYGSSGTTGKTDEVNLVESSAKKFTNDPRESSPTLVIHMPTL